MPMSYILKSTIIPLESQAALISLKYLNQCYQMEVLFANWYNPSLPA